MAASGARSVSHVDPTGGSRFRRDTAVTRLDDRTFESRLDPAWWVQRGPNGGYLAGIVQRAIVEAVDDPQRSPRSLTVHFTAPPEEGTVTTRVEIERTGRSLTSVSARVHQGDRLVAVALGALSASRPGPELADRPMPSAPAPGTIAAVDVPAEAPPIAHRWDVRWAVGRRPFVEPPGDEAVGGGWIRLEDPQAYDAPAIAALTDAWIPPIFARLPGLYVVPTVDLTIHYRAPLPHPGVADDAFLFAVFRTSTAADGFLEEDSEVWAPDGTLLAQSRQLAAVLSP